MNKAYPNALKKLHWLIAVLVILQVSFGLIIEDVPFVLYLHLATGSTILLLSVIRLKVRHQEKENLPGKLHSMSLREWKLVKTGHKLLYILLFITPLSGILAYIFDKDQGENIFHEIHETIVWIFVAVIAAHIIMTVKHIISDKENPMKRIL